MCVLCACVLCLCFVCFRVFVLYLCLVLFVLLFIIACICLCVCCVCVCLFGLFCFMLKGFDLCVFFNGEICVCVVCFLFRCRDVSFERVVLFVCVFVFS